MKLHRHLTANEEQLKPFPFSRELSMESYLVENEGILALDDDAFSDVTIVQEELTLKQGRKSKDTDGRIDLLITYSNEYIGVVELKLGELNEVHLTQLEDYLEQKSKIEKEFPDILDRNISPENKWIGVLVGSSISADLAQKIEQGYTTSCGVQIAALTIQRFRGQDRSVYVTTDIFHKNGVSARDYQRYNFCGQTYGKGRLVQAVIKKYAEDHPDASFSDLSSVFTRDIQGSRGGVFSTKADAEKILNDSGRRRHFLKPEELVKLADTTVAVSSQWGVGNIPNFIKKAREVGYQINECSPKPE